MKYESVSVAYACWLLEHGKISFVEYREKLVCVREGTYHQRRKRMASRRGTSCLLVSREKEGERTWMISEEGKGTEQNS